MTQHLSQVLSQEWNVPHINARRAHSVVVTGPGIVPGTVGFVVLVGTECDTRPGRVDVKLPQSITVWFPQQSKSFIFIYSIVCK